MLQTCVGSGPVYRNAHKVFFQILVDYGVFITCGDLHWGPVSGAQEASPDLEDSFDLKVM